MEAEKTLTQTNKSNLFGFNTMEELSEFLKHPLIQNEIILTERNTKLRLWSDIVRNVILEFSKNNPELENIEISWNKKEGLKNNFTVQLDC